MKNHYLSAGILGGKLVGALGLIALSSCAALQSAIAPGSGSGAIASSLANVSSGASAASGAEPTAEQKQYALTKQREDDNRAWHSYHGDNELTLQDMGSRLEDVLRWVAGKAAMNAGKEPISTGTLVAKLKAGKYQMSFEPPPPDAKFPRSFLAIAVKSHPQAKRGPDPLSEEFTLFAYHVFNINMVLYQATGLAQGFALHDLQATSLMLSDRRYIGATLNEQDYELVRAALAQARRAEGYAALTTGLKALLQGAVQQNKDPKALDAFAEKGLAALDAKPQVSDAEVRAYCESAAGDPLAAKERYATWMKQAYGPEEFEKTYKRWLDDQFAIIENAAKRKPAAQEQSDKAAERAAANASPSAALAQAAQLSTDATLRNSIDGIRALAKGDAKGAASFALRSVPNGPVKEALSFAAKFL